MTARAPMSPVAVAALGADLRRLVKALALDKPAPTAPAPIAKDWLDELNGRDHGAEEGALAATSKTRTQARLALELVRRDLQVSDADREVARMAGITPEALAAQRNPAAAAAAQALEHFIASADSASSDANLSPAERDIVRMTGAAVSDYLVATGDR